MRAPSTDDQIRSHLAALEAAPADPAAFSALERIYQDGDRWEDLVKLYEGRARASGSDDAVALLAKAAELARRQLKNRVRAEELYRRLLDADPKHSGALVSIVEICEEKGDWLGVAEALERQADRAQDPRTAGALYLKLGQVWEEKLARRDRAALFFIRAARLEPRMRSGRDKAVAACISLRRYGQAKRILDASRDAGADPKDVAAEYATLGAKLVEEPLEHDLAIDCLNDALTLDKEAPGAAAAMSELQAAPKTWRDQARSLRAQAVESRDRRGAALLYLRIAQLHAAYDPDARPKVQENLDRLFLLWPGMIEALDFVERFHAMREDWKGLSESLAKAAAGTRDRAAAAALQLRLAAVHLVHFSDRKAALAAFEKAAELDPANEAASVQAFELRTDDGDAAEAVGLVERHLAAAPARPGQVSLRLKAAELSQKKLEDPERTRKHLEAALRLDPKCQQAAAQLLPLYQGGGEWKKAVELLEVRISGEGVDAERVRLHEEIAEILQDKLGNPREALRQLIHALFIDPKRSKTRKAMERAAAAADDFVDLARAFRGAADAVTDLKVKKQLLRRVAEIYDRDLANAEEATLAWRKLVEIDPEDKGAAAALEACLAKAGQHQELADGYKKKLESARDKKTKRELAGKLAKLHEDRGDFAEAASAWRKLLQDIPGDGPAMAGLAGALRQGAAEFGPALLEELASTLAKLSAEASEVGERVGFELERAALLAGRLGRPTESANAYLAVLGTEKLPSGQGAEAVAALERLLGQGVETQAIAAALAPRFAAEGDWAKHVLMLEVLATAAETDAAVRARLLLDIAAVRDEKLADHRGALTAATAALRAAPTHAEARARCEKLAAEVGAFGELYELLVGLAEPLRAGDPAHERSLRMRAAEIAERDLGRNEDAASQLRRCLELSPKDPEVLAALCRLALSGERWEEAAELLEARAVLAGGAEKAALVIQRADILEERLGRPADAAALYRASLDATPAPSAEASQRLLSKLATALEGAGDAEALAPILEQLAERTSDPGEKARLELKRAKLSAGALHDASGAVRHFQAVLAVRPADADAIAALEAMLDGADAIDAARALQPGYEKLKEHRKLVRTIEIEAEAAREPAEKAACWRRIAGIYERELRQLPLAFAAMSHAVRIVPADGTLRAELRRLADEAETTEECAELYEEIAAAVQGEATLPIWRELAEWSEKKLSSKSRATTCYQRMLALDGDNLDALAALRRLHRAAERYPELYATCMKLAEVVYDDEERLQIWREAAVIAEGKLVQPERAAQAWRKIAEKNEGDLEAAAALDRLYEQLGNAEDLAWALARRRVQASGSERERDLAFRLADLKKGRLNDPQEAIVLYAQILRADPAHPGARSALEELARAAGKLGADALQTLDAILATAGEHARRVEVREARLNNVDDGAERARLYSELRGLYERDVGQPSMAFVVACRAFGEGGEPRAEAQAQIERLAEQTQSFEELAEVYEEAAGAASGTEAAELRRLAARVREDKLKDPVNAIAAWKAVLEGVADDAEALDALQRLYSGKESAKELAAVTLRKAQKAQGMDRVRALLQYGQLAAEGLGDNAAAITAYREVIELDPKSVAAFEALDRLYSREKRGEDLAPVLYALADLVREAAPTRRIELLLRRAALFEEYLRDTKRAIDAYAELLAGNPQEPGAVAGLERMLLRPESRDPAARLLEDVYRLSGDSRRLVEVLELRFEGAAPAERAPLLAEVAVLHERLGQKPSAFVAKLRHYRETLANGQDDPAVRADLERLATETTAWDELAGAFEDALDSGVGGAAGLELKRRLATIHEKLGAFDRAAAWLEQVAAAGPDAEALEGLAKIYRRQNALRELAHVYLRQVSLAEARDAKKDLYFEVATIMEEHLSDREGAIDAYRQILSIDPDDPNALKLLGRLLGETERWDELTAVLAREVENAEKREGFEIETAELRYRLGRIRQQRLMDAAGALGCFKGVLAKVPRHPAAIAALEELAKGSGPTASEAAQVLEPIYEHEGDHAKLVQALEARVAQTSDASGRAALLRRVADVYAGPLQSPDMAFVAASRAVQEDPDDLEALAMAVKQAEAAALPDELVGLLSDNADKARESRARVEYRRRLARLFGSPAFAEPKKAVQEWTRLLDLAPDDDEALQSLTSLNRASGDGDALASILRRRLSVEEDANRRVELFGELAQVQEEKLKDPGQAMATLRRLLELQPENREALARIDRICTRGERWVDLAEVLPREIQAADAAGDKAAVVQLGYRLAELKETRLLDRDGAVALYQQILATRPDHGESVARLEGILAKDPHQTQAAEILEGVYKAVGNWDRYARSLETRAAAQHDSEELKRLYLEVADVRERRLNNPELGFLALCRAFRADPSDVQVRKELERNADAAEHHEELAALYEEEIDRLSPQALVEVCLKLGALNEERLEDPDKAIAYYMRARETDPAGAPKALGPLDRLYRKLEKWSELADVLRAEADRETEAREKIGILFRLGQLADEKLQRIDDAAHAYEEVVALDGKQLPALRALERLYEQAGVNDKLFDNLAAQRGLAGDPASKERLGAKMALTAAALDNAAVAIDLWKEVLAAKPRHDQGLQQLEVLYEKSERWQELAELLRTRLAGTVDRREITRLNDKLGWLMGTKLGNAADAIKSFKAVLDSDPKNRRALEALRDIYTVQGNTEELVGTYRRLIPLQEDAAGVKGVRLKLADVLLGASRREEAVEQGKRAFDLEPHSPADLARIEEVFRTAGAWNEVVKATEARAAILAEANAQSEAVAAWFAAAELWREQLKKRDSAAAALEKVMEIEPANRTAYSSLRDIYSATGNWREFTRVCEHFAPHVTDKGEKIGLLKELAEVHERKLGQKEMAFLALCRAFAEIPTDFDIADKVMRLASETEAYDELADVYEQVSEDAEGVIKVGLLITLGRIRDEKLDDAEGSESAFRKALDVDPSSHEALDALTLLFGKRGRVRELVITLEQKLEAAASLDEKKATLVEIARVYDERLKDVPEAIGALKRVLELDGSDPSAIDLLAAIYRREKRWPDLAGILARARDLAADAAARAGYQLHIGKLYEEEIQDDEAAIEAYRAVLDLDDQSAPALGGLERLYTKLDRFAELNKVYERQVALTDDNREKVKVLSKSGAIWEEKLHDNARAIDASERVLQLDGAQLPAVKNLERLYRQEGLWEKLISVLTHHTTISGDKTELVRLNLEIGEVWWKELSRVDRAEAVFSHAIEIDSDSKPAINALGKLYERSGNWNLSLEMIKREARLAGAGPEAVELYFRMGKINEDMLLDAGAAKACYNHALDLDASYLPAIRALKMLHELEKDRDAYLESLIAEAKYTEDAVEKTRLLYEVGKFYQEERDDRANATRYYEESLKRTPDYLAAAKPLADIYIAEENWARAETMLDIVVKKLAVEGEPKDLCRQAYRLGYVGEKLERKDKALDCYRKAYDLDATYLPALEGLGNLLVQTQNWDEALRIYQAILIHHRDGLTDLEVVEIYWQIGEIQSKLGQSERAIKSFDKALEIDQGHEPSRQSLVRIYEEASDFESAIEHRQKLLAVLEGEAKFKMYVSIGEICRDKLKDPYQATDAFIGALKLDPSSLAVMESLLGLYRETKQGQKAADILEKMLAQPEIDADPNRAGKLYFALGEILRDDIRDEDAAIKQLNKALDKNPRLISAFSAIETLLSSRKKWTQLEEAYIKMIQRLPKTADVQQARLALWRTLGELYRRVLKNLDGAAQAYGVVAKANPQDAEAAEVLADLLAQKPGKEDEAIAAYRNCLKVAANPQKSVSALVGLHAARKEYDKAYTAAQVLTHLLGVATPEEQQVVAKLRRYARDAASRTMTDRLWTDHLYHEKTRGPLAEIMSLVHTQAGELFGQSHKDLGINPKKDEIDVASSMLFFVNMYKYVARTLGMEALKLYRVEGRAGGLTLASTWPVGIIAGEEMFKDRPKKELWFSIAKTMAFSRPELVMARLMPHDQLEVVFQAACSLGTSKFVVTADPHQVEKMKRQLERSIPESARMPLKQLARKYCEVQQAGDVRAYMDGAELTSNRAGILLASDIDVAKKAILSEKAQVSKLRDQTKIRDLVLFCLSEDYATLREQLGLSVVVKV